MGGVKGCFIKRVLEYWDLGSKKVSCVQEGEEFSFNGGMVNG